MNLDRALAIETPAARMTRSLGSVARQGYALFATVLLIVLVITTELLDSHQLGSNITATIGTAAPLILAAMAQTPPILSGGGGIDLSVGPLMGLANAIVVTWIIGSAGIQSPLLIIPAMLAIGILSGALNGILVTFVRLQPIVVTLGTFLIFSGLTLWVMPQPQGTVPPWLASIATTYHHVPLPVVVIALVLLGWGAWTRLPIYEQMMAVGGNDRTAYASAVNVQVVRASAYVVGGLIASVAGLSLTALLGSGDPTIGPTYTLEAIAAVALGGIGLAGGRGGMFGAVVGACDIFLVENVLTFFNISTFALEVVYGVILIIAIVLNTLLGRYWSRTRAAAA